MGALRNIKDDLVERRLWPVALLLVVALIAVPLLLSNSSDSDDPGDTNAPPVVEAPAALGGGGPGGAPNASGGGTLQLTATAGSLGDSSSRRPRDPFKPDDGSTAEATATAADEQGPAQPEESDVTTLAALDGDVSTTVGDEPSASTAGAADGSTGGGDPGAGGTPGAGGDTGGGGGSTGPGRSPSGGGGGGGTPQPNPPAPSTLEYPIDARFGAAGATRARTGLEPLRALPSEDNPVVIYLGSSDDRREATFLVSAELEVQGDGTCRPSRNECTTLLLEAGDTAILDGLDPDGKPVQYELELTRIGATPVRVASGSSASLAMLAEPARPAGAD